MRSTETLTRTTLTAILALLLVATLSLGATKARGAAGPTLDLSLCAPDRNTFTLAIDNTYFPLPVGRRWTLAGKEQGQELGFRVTVLNRRETFYEGSSNPVTTRVVEEREWEDTDGDGTPDPGEALLEVSVNYFAQTADGTVCYFGENVDIYESGVVVSHEGSWRADDEGHAPGIFMPAHPEVGMRYQQEVAPGIAEDEATIVGTGSIKTTVATFENAIKVRDVNPLDGSKGIKWYAPDVGIVVDGPLALVDYRP